jgi:hypothetical protein
LWTLTFQIGLHGYFPFFSNDIQKTDLQSIIINQNSNFQAQILLKNKIMKVVLLFRHNFEIERKTVTILN